MADSSLHDAARIIELLEGKLQAARDKRREPIAVIGLAARLPFESQNMTIWEGLSRGVDASSEIPNDRFDTGASFYDPNPGIVGKSITKRGSFISNIREFDAPFFAIAPVEAQTMDPQQRLILEVAWEALANASMSLEAARRVKTGVFVGCATEDYLMTLASAGFGAGELDLEDARYLTTGTAQPLVAGRISYAFGLTGPSFVVDTACSSSLVATHVACESLRSRSSDVALVGGVSVVLSPHGYPLYSAIGALSPDGRCRTFDASANGFARGEGCSVVVLKRLSDALRDGDRVIAVLRGSAVNQDGPSDGLTAPNGLAQQDLIRSALDFAALKPGDVQYVETHGTATVLGDPIEVDALSEVYGPEHTKSTPLMVGSIKSNIGHLDAGAGVAGLVKVILSVEHRELPPSLHVQTPNPHIPWDRIPVRVQTKLGPWPSPEKPLIGGVSAFGIGGTNAHVLVGEAPKEDPNKWSEADRLSQDVKVLPLCVSAKTPEALRAYAKRFADHLSAPLEGATTWRDVAFTASARQTHLEHRLVVVGKSAAEWAEKLREHAEGRPARGVVTSESATGRSRVVFVFPGQGSQWLGMGRSLLESSAVFREHVERCEAAFGPHVDWSLKDQLSGDPAKSRLADIDVIQPTIFAVQTGLAAVWASWGVVPDAVVGHSMGEVAAAFVAGALSIEDAASVICIRSKLLRRVRGRGAMAVIEMTMAETESELASYGGKISVAASNGPRSTVVSGDANAVASLMESLKQREVFCRPVKVDVASHSNQVDELKTDLLRELGGLRPKTPSLAFVSTALVDSKAKPELDANYWWSNLREPVRLSQRVGELMDEGFELFVELSPHPVLTVSIEESLRAGGKTTTVIASSRRDEPEPEVLLEALGALHAAGYPVDWKTFFAVPGRAVTLPSYPWQRKRYWLEISKKTKRSVDSKWALVHRHYTSSETANKHVFEVELDLADKEQAYFGEHKVQGVVWFPAAGYLDMVLEAASMAFEGKFASVEGLKLSEALSLAGGEPTLVQLVIAPEEKDSFTFRIASRAASGADAVWTEHASGQLVVTAERDAVPSITLAEVQKRCTREKDVKQLYEDFVAAGISHGPPFQGLLEGWAGDGEGVSKLEDLSKLTTSVNGYVVHPSLLDAAIQTIAVARPSTRQPMVPSTIGRLRVHTKAKPRWVYVKERSVSDAGLTADVLVFDEKGRVAVEIEGVGAVPLGKGRDKLDEWLVETVWRASAMKGSDTAKGAWLLLADEQGIGTGLRRWLETQGGEVVTVTRGARYAKKDATHYEVDPASPESILQLLKEVYGKTAPRRIVSLWALDTRATAESPLDEKAIAQSQILTVTSLLHLTQAVAQIGWTDPARLFVVTRGCQPATGSRDVVFPEQALAWGFAGTIAHEMAELKPTMIDIDGGITSELLGRALAEGDDETRVAVRGSDRLAARLTRHSRPKAIAGGLRSLTVSAEEGYALDPVELGRLEFTLQPAPVPKPQPGGVVIRVRASGINFLDVLSVQGMLPWLPKGRLPIGGECSGVVHAVGEGVNNVRVGDEVVAVGHHGFDAYFVTGAQLVTKKPKGLSFEQAASLPSVACTVVYSLDDVARLQKGEKILIHAATGGVGLVAVQYAKYVGAEIYATAGSEAKRAYLRSIGIEHVYDSRTLAWADEVKRDTNGVGVDVVLNSLAGDAIRKGVSVLAPWGRFIELGKRDLYANTPLGLYGIRNNVMVRAVTLDRLVLDRPAAFAPLFEKTFELIEKGLLKPVPVETFSISQVADAFHQLARAQHIGKVVVKAEETVTVRDAARSDQIVPDKTYLITGGFGGLGLVVAKRLAKLGAKHIALLGRSGPSPEANAIVQEIEASGVRVHAVRADLTQMSALKAALAELARSAPPIAGLIHSAVVLDDATISSLTADRVGPVLGPKFAGTLALEALLPDVEFRLYFSSMAGVLGAPGQSHYAAASTFQDAFAHYLRGSGKHGLAVNWGAWADVGSAVRSDRVDNIARLGLAAISPTDGVEIFERMLASTSAEVGVFPVDLRQWRQVNPQAADMALLKEVAVAKTAATNSNLLERLRTASTSADRVRLLVEYLRGAVAQVLRMAPESLSPTAPFKQLGFDSLMTVSLKNVVERDLAVPVTSGTLFAHPTIDRLAAHIAQRFGATDAPEVRAPAVAQVTPVKAPVAPKAAEAPTDLAFAERMRLIESELDAD